MLPARCLQTTAYHVSRNVPLKPRIVQVNRKQLNVFLITDSKHFIAVGMRALRKISKVNDILRLQKKSQTEGCVNDQEYL